MAATDPTDAVAKAALLSRYTTSRKLIAARRARSMSLSDVAAATGLPLWAIEDFETTEDCDAIPAVVVRYAAAVGVELESH